MRQSVSRAITPTGPMNWKTHDLLDVIGRSTARLPCCGTTRIGTNSPTCSTASPVTDSTRCGPASTSGARRSTISPTSPRPSGPPTDELPLALTPEVESISDDGDTVKWLWRLHDGDKIETVLMHYDDRTTVCVSSQAGCDGVRLLRHRPVRLRSPPVRRRIVEQIVRARRQSAPQCVSMSSWGWASHSPTTTAHGPRSNASTRTSGSALDITISTVGVVPGIERLAEEDLPVNLAVSLHAANDRDRDKLVPLNKRYPLDRLHEPAQRYLDARTGASQQWALIDGVNDRDSDVDELADYARSLRAHINLIPLNPPRLSHPQDLDRVYAFRDALNDRGANATVQHARYRNRRCLRPAASQPATRRSAEMTRRCATRRPRAPMLEPCRPDLGQQPSTPNALHRAGHHVLPRRHGDPAGRRPILARERQPLRLHAARRRLHTAHHRRRDRRRSASPTKRHGATNSASRLQRPCASGSSCCSSPGSRRSPSTPWGSCSTSP